MVRLVPQPGRPDRVRAGRGVPGRRGGRGARAVGALPTAQRTLPPHLAETPRIVNTTVPQQDWSRLGEMAVPGDA
ncbi:hypothetical protein V2I01_36560 [Micromonospora sp. BRA006-A]|nr:hypothetical protein [Micromonospora sp. BRA006-A]